MPYYINTLFWGTVAFILVIATFGFLNILFATIYLCCFIFGSIAVLYEYSQKEVQTQKKYFSSSVALQTAFLKPGIKSVLEDDSLKENVLAETQSLTGSPEIDIQIEKCLDYLMRDYIKYWYNDLSDDKQFLYHFRLLLQHCIRDISLRSQAMEWQPYLTTVLVDQFASHLKFFRKAKQEFDLCSQTDSVDNPSTSTNSSEANSVGSSAENCQDDKIKLLDLYFENEIESGNICRDLISCDSKTQHTFLQDISEIVLYIILPQKEFQCKPLKYLLRETMVNGIFLPMLNLYSSPDYLNQYVSWLISDNCVSSEWFLTVLRHTNTVEELSAVRDKAEEEIQKVTSKDRVGDDPIVKQQLSSMHYVCNICQQLMLKQQEQGTFEYSDFEKNSPSLAKSKLYNFPLSVVLRNNIALQIFIEYMQSVGGQAYLFFWLTVDGYRASAEQQVSEMKAQQSKGASNGTLDIEMLRTVANNIYDQYLSKHADHRVVLEANVDKQLKKKLDSGEPSPNVFDDVQLKVFNIMQKDERFFPEFKSSSHYLRMLAELDLLDEASLNSIDTTDSILSSSSQDDQSIADVDEGVSKLSAVITQTGTCTEHGKTYALYAITVTRSWSSGKEDSWSTFRRYREFYDLHCSLKENGSNLGNLRLPGKTLFKDLKEEFLERRRSELNQYLSSLLEISHPVKAMECLHTFLDEKAYHRNSRSFARKVDTMMQTSMRNVTNFVSQAPDNLIDGIQKASDKMSDGFQRISDILPTSVDKRDPDEKLQEQIMHNIDNNLPIGILLLLMDEIFDLRRKNQWLRRQIVTGIQQVLRTLFGDRMNKKIIDYVESAVAAEQIALFVERFCDNFWPNGILADKMPPREKAIEMRNRVLTKTKMHGVIPVELRRIVGNETCRRGVVQLFELMQYRELNFRFCCVLLEGIVKKIFPSNKFEEIFEKFHTSSPKIRSYNRKKETRAVDRAKTSSKFFQKQSTYGSLRSTSRSTLDKPN